MLASIVASADADRVRVELPTDVVRIAVLNDQSGVFTPISVAPGGGRRADGGRRRRRLQVLGKPIEVLVGDHQSKPDIGVAIARQWGSTP